MRTIFSILLALVVINPFCACGAVRGDAHAVEKVAVEACGHGHCQHDDESENGSKDSHDPPCKCDHQVEFVTPAGGSLALQTPQLAVIAEITFSPEARLASPFAVGYRSVPSEARLSAATPPLWRYHCALML